MSVLIVRLEQSLDEVTVQHEGSRRAIRIEAVRLKHQPCRASQRLLFRRGGGYRGEINPRPVVFWECMGKQGLYRAVPAYIRQNDAPGVARQLLQVLIKQSALKPQVLDQCLGQRMARTEKSLQLRGWPVQPDICPV